MAFEQERSLAASSAFTMAAIVGFINIWFLVHPGNNSRVVESLDKTGLPARIESREFAAATQQVRSFLELIAPSSWSLDLPTVIVSEERPFAYLIEHSTITIGRQTVASHGQLQRAFLRAVLMKNVPQLDIFHRDVFTDALYFMMNGKFDFVDPVSGPVPYKPDHWLAQIDSLRGICMSAWKPMELLSVCESKVDSPRVTEWDDVVSIFSLKPIVLSQLAKRLNDLSVAERLGFARGWIEAVSARPWELPGAISSLKTVPLTISAILMESFGLEPKNVDFEYALYRIDSKQFIARSILLRSSQMEFPLIFQIGENLYLNHLRLPATARRDFDPSKMIWQVCEMPTLGQLNRIKAKSNRVLLLSECSQLTSGFRAYFLNDTESFSSTDGQTPFLSVFLPSVKLALKWGARPEQVLEFGSDEPTRLERLLGFNEPRLSGVIPLVDSYRSDRPGQSVRLSN